jgi:Ca-activated chloride channel family protein
MQYRFAPTSVATALALVAVATLSAQQQQSAPTPEPDQPSFRASVRTVSIYATVLDDNGRLVPDLRRDDFTVLEDGKPVELTLFSNEPQPFTAVVMLDTSASMTANLDLLSSAAEQFLLRLHPVDRARVGAFNDKIQLSDAFTNNRDSLIEDLRELQFGNPTRLNDAIGVSLDALEPVDGRRVVLMFTDGEDTASKTGFRTVLDRARNEEVMVYAIGLESEYFNGMRLQRSRPSRDRRKIADETGGGYFELKKTDELAPTFTRVAQELRSQYLLGFSPVLLDGKPHKLEVRLKRPGLTARARRTYIAVPDRTTTSQ